MVGASGLATASPSVTPESDAEVAGEETDRSAYEAGVLAYEAGDIVASVALFREATRQEAGSTRSMTSLAFALVLSGDLAAAEQTWWRLASRAPGDVVALQGLATVRALRGDRAGARRMFERWVAEDASAVAGWRGLGRACVQAEDWACAVPALERARVLDGEDDDSGHLLVEAYRRGGRRRSARRLRHTLKGP